VVLSNFTREAANPVLRFLLLQEIEMFFTYPNVHTYVTI